MEWRLGLAALLVAALACGAAASEAGHQLNLYPTATPNATMTPEPTQTPRIVQVEVTAQPSPTPSPTPFAPYPAQVRGVWYCHARADLASKTIEYLADGLRVMVIGRSGDWLQVKTDRAVCFVNAVAIP